MNMMGFASLFISRVAQAMLLLHKSSKSKFSKLQMISGVIRCSLVIEQNQAKRLILKPFTRAVLISLFVFVNLLRRFEAAIPACCHRQVAGRDFLVYNPG